VGWHGGEIKSPHLDKLAEGGAKLEQCYVHHHHTMPNSGAIRMGDWKLVLNGHITANELKAALADNAAKSRVALFNLADDPEEEHDLSAKHPEKVKQLRERLKSYRAAAVPPKADGEPANYKAPRVWGK
jgi:arylsulfatase A-like enzyme